MSIAIVAGPAESHDRSAAASRSGDSSLSRTSSRTPRAASRSARKLCSVSRSGRERHDDGGRTSRENVEHGIVPGLADRDAAAPQHLRKIRPIAFEDHALGQTGWRVPRIPVRASWGRQAGAKSRFAKTSPSAGLERRRQQRTADCAAASRDHDLVARQRSRPSSRITGFVGLARRSRCRSADRRSPMRAGSSLRTG